MVRDVKLYTEVREGGKRERRERGRDMSDSPFFEVGQSRVGN